MPKRPEPKETPLERPVKRVSDMLKSVFATGTSAVIAELDAASALGARMAEGTLCTTCGGRFASKLCPTDGTKLHE